MLRLKKKKAEAAEAAKSAASSDTASTGDSASSSPSPMETDDNTTKTNNGVSLLGGIGGKKVKKSEGGKKRTPGEIRIQKGELKYIVGTREVSDHDKYSPFYITSLRHIHLYRQWQHTAVK